MKSILHGSRPGWSADGPDAVVVFGLDEGERVEAAGLGGGRGLAAQTTAPARGVAHAVERHGVADEAILDGNRSGGPHNILGYLRVDELHLGP
jgi:hypothetical protein